MKVVTAILFLSFTVSNLNAAKLSDCPPGAHSANTNGTYSGQVTDGSNTDTWDSYSIPITSDGDLSIDYSSTRNTRVWFTTDSSNNCRNNRILSSGTTATDTLSGLHAGDTVYIQLRERIGGGNTANYSFSLSFTPTGNPPIANDDSATTERQRSVDIDVLDNDRDDDGDAAIDPTTVVVNSLPSHGTVTVDSATGAITYTPESPFDPANTGAANADTFTYSVADVNGQRSAEATVSVTITANTNTDPVANDKTFTTPAGSAITGNVITAANAQSGSADSDPDGDKLSVKNWGPVHFGTLSTNDDGTFTYTPNSGFIGTETFSYQVEDGYGGSATATVTITVTAAIANLSVQKSASASTVITGQQFTFTIVVNSSDTNTSFTEAKNVQVTDTLPSGVGFNSVSAPPGFTCSQAAGTVTCDAPSILPGYSDAITITATALVEGNVTNTAHITADTPEFDNSDNDSAVDIQIVTSSADLSISKTAPASVNTATAYVYTLTVSNAGPNEAENVQITDDLPSNVQFVSVDGGSDWSCSQGPLVICDYIANGGKLPTGTAPSVTITVTSPPQNDTVLNSADVVSSTPDPDVSNNHDNATVTVNFGTNIGGSVPLSKYLQFNVYGDIKLIGNANINKRPGDPDQNYNDSVYMQFVGFQNKNTIFNASSSTLAIDSSYEIEWAGLYWAGHICKNGNGCDYSHLPNNRNSYSEAKPHLGEIRFKRPGHGYIDIVANNLNRIERNSDGATDLTYGAFADITHLIDQNNFNGTYSVANMLLTEGKTGGRGGNYGGWALLFIFKDPTNQLHFKNVSVFNGFQYITSDNNNIDIDGFVTPFSGTINSSIALFAADGDPQLGGTAKMRIGKSGSYDYIGGDALNPTSNLLNSTVSEFGSPINTGVTKTYGVDADRIDVSSFIDHNQSDTRFKFNVTNSVDNHVDYYSLNMFAFATDLVSPLIDNFDKSAVIRDINGSLRPADSNATVYPGSELIYTLTFSNTGDEIAQEVELFDDFDFDGLSSLLDLSNFNLSKLKLSKKGNVNVWQSNPNCGYYGGQHRAYCKIDKIEIGETYKMQFSVNVKSSLTAADVDKNLTNTAYAKYKNPTTGSYVVLYELHGQSVGGKSNSLTAGRIGFGGGGGGLSYPTLGMDAINSLYSYVSDRNITTKIVAKPFSLKLVHLDAFGNPSAYHTPLNYDMEVMLTLCNRDDIIITSGTLPKFTDGTTTLQVNNLIVPQALRDDKIKMRFIDWNAILSWPSAPPSCVVNSSLNGNLKAVPQCLNSAPKMRALFSDSNWSYVRDVCLGDSYAPFANGTAAPCDSNAYNASGPIRQIIPNKYNNPYGCYQCLADANSSFVSCSSDNFAVRPEKFEMSSSDGDFPDLLRAGLDYTMTVHAPNGNGVDTDEYNQTHTNLELNQTTYLPNGTAGDLNGTLSFATANDFNISDGISTDASGAHEVMGFTFDDVGVIGIRLIDKNWAAIDNDDTPQECRNVLNTNGEYGTYICSEEVNTTFIPEHFTVTVDDVHNNNGGNTFTYLSNDLNMSAKVGITITAENAQNGTTKNFTEGLYEHAMTVTLTVPDSPSGQSAIKKEIASEKLLGFGTDGDPHGVKHIPWDENDNSLQLLFNYPRQVNLPVNPFGISGVVESFASSEYVSSQGAPNSTAIITGQGDGTGDVLFIYGRVHAPRYRVVCDSTGACGTTSSPNQPLKFYMEFFYDAAGTIDANTTLSTTLASESNRSVDSVRWYKNPKHANSDGNITGFVQKFVSPSPITAPTTVSFSGGEGTGDFTYDGSDGYPYKATMQINSQSWLIYNMFDGTATTNDFELEFNAKTIGSESNNTSGVTANPNTTRRIRW